MTQGNRTAPGVHAGIVVFQAQHAHHSQALRCKGFVQLNHVHVVDGQASLGQHFERGGRRANAHDARCHTGSGHAHDAGFGRQAVFGSRGFIGQQQGTRTVVHTRGVACGHGAVWAHHTFELGQRFEAGFTRVLVGVHQNSIAFFLGNAHAHNFTRQVSGFDGGHGTQLAVVGHQVLRFALNLVIGGHVFCGLGHGVHTVLGFHQLVDEAPANGGVIDRVVAAEGGFGLGHHKGGAAHAFHTTGNHQTGFTRFDGAGGGANGVQTRAAQAVDGRAGHVDRQTGQQAAHVGHVAVVFARLVGAAVEHIGHGGPVHIGVAGHQGAQGDRAQVVGAHAAQGTAVAAKGGTDRVANVSLVHVTGL